MLKELYIENLAVIEKASISFTNNLNVFTGETGAGKSILINGINAILGQRVTKDIVRSGENKAVISGLFCNLNENVLEKLTQLGFEAEDGQITLTREIRSDGGSVARINQRAVSVWALREIGETLVNIHGQHDNQILLSPEKHINVLDSYGESEQLLADYRESFKQLQLTAKKIGKLKEESDRRNLRIQQLREKISDITSLDITDTQEYDEISAELEVSKNAVAISEAVYTANMILSGDEDTSGVVDMVSDASSRIDGYTDIMRELSPLAQRLNSASIELKDISQELSSILGGLDVDPQRFDWLNQRSEELKKAMQKYGPQLTDVMETLEKSQKELAKLMSGEENMTFLLNEKKHLLTEVSIKAKKLSEHRKKAGENFVEQVTQELEFLNMPNVKLVVSQVSGKLTINGMDNIEFLISANVGEQPKSIAKIASGGELSRIMLALKNVIAHKDLIDTLIFDEIDTGVSGRAAQKIGMKLREISKQRQVLCVTHLAQIGVMADNHLLIEKNIIDERTVTTVKKLDFEGRKREIARIMGGENISELMLKNAEEYLNEASKC